MGNQDNFNQVEVHNALLAGLVEVLLQRCLHKINTVFASGKSSSGLDVYPCLYQYIGNNPANDIPPFREVYRVPFKKLKCRTLWANNVI